LDGNFTKIDVGCFFEDGEFEGFRIWKYWQVCGKSEILKIVNCKKFGKAFQ